MVGSGGVCGRLTMLVDDPDSYYWFEVVYKDGGDVELAIKHIGGRWEGS